MVRRRVGNLFKVMKETNEIRKRAKHDLKLKKKTIKGIKGSLKDLDEFERRVRESPRLDDEQKENYYKQIQEARRGLSETLREANLRKKELRREKSLLNLFKSH